MFTSLEPTLFRHLFDEYVKLTGEHPQAGGSAIILELHPFKKIASVPTSATALANRGQWYKVICSMRWQSEQLDQQVRIWTSEQLEYVRAEERKRGATSFVNKKAYANYGLVNERSREMFGDNYERLRELKARYDPKNVFHKSFPITPKTA